MSAFKTSDAFDLDALAFPAPGQWTFSNFTEIWYQMVIEVQNIFDPNPHYVGVDEVTARAGGKDLEKACTTPKLLKLYFMLLGAKTYLKFVQKRRDYKYIVSTMNAAKCWPSESKVIA